MSPVAIVTGAARGIGAATVDALVAAGWHVLAVDRCRDVDGVPYAMATPAELDAMVARHPGRVLGLVGDARSAPDMGLAVETAVAQFGGVDAAVAAAGVIAGGQPLWETSDDVVDAVMSVNLDGVRRLFSAVVPALLEAPAPRHGRLVAVASAAAHVGLLHLSAYSASKHAVVGLVRGLAADLASSGITANAVCPGSTRTAMLDASAAIYGLDTPEALAEHQPIGRLLEPAEPAALIAWLCSEAASGITGAAMAVDGGMTSV
ncbi:MAG TPA: mycofactocin-coupled SDR family oxidoreductase [Acidimicrobiales bacterium]|jgi:SDR family mycofactocin-dependent oxidoreductase|nr:mycofactocin-coupled SDR family oxidoreductase [Acidimicrobiales bacterium]